MKESLSVRSFTGQSYDRETGLYHFMFREYDPVAGVWTTTDPIKDGWDWWAYCGNDPVNYIDLLGLKGDPDINPYLYGNWPTPKTTAQTIKPPAPKTKAEEMSEKFKKENACPTPTPVLPNPGKADEMWEKSKRENTCSTKDVRLAPGPSNQVLKEIQFLLSYCTDAHILKKDEEFREKNPWARHDACCNEIAIRDMYKSGYNPGPFSQNTEIRKAVDYYIKNKYATDRPIIGTTGYIFYYGLNEDGSYSWNHQERYIYYNDGTFVFFRTDGVKPPKDKELELTEILTKKDFLNKTWSNKTDILFVATDVLR